MKRSDGARNLVSSLMVASDVLATAGIALNETTAAAITAAIKTFRSYSSTLRSMTRQLYGKEITELSWATSFMSVIAGQFRRAWFEGMHLNGLTASDMTQQWEYELDRIIQGEHDFILQFGDAIVDAANNGLPLEPLLGRCELWANRYEEIVDRARIITGTENQLYVWQLGTTERHCPTCATLNGQVMTGKDWLALEARGIYPKSRQLACGGYRCDCERVPVRL